MDDRELATLIDGWPVGVAAAGVTTAAATVAAAGPVSRPFPLASVTKVLVALACWVAVEEETIALDEPAGPPGSTVAHLLAHASGLPADDGPPVAAPGTRRLYSNAGFEELGRHLGAAAGIPVATYLAEAVAAPLGCAATALDGSPAHGASASVSDLLAVGRELLTPTLIAPVTLAHATRPVFGELAGILPGFGHQDPNPWGLGVEVRGSKHPHWTGRSNSPATFGHFGRSGTFLWVDPDAGVAVAALTDTEFGPWAARAWPELSDEVLRSLAPPAR